MGELTWSSCYPFSLSRVKVDNTVWAIFGEQHAENRVCRESSHEKLCLDPAGSAALAGGSTGSASSGCAVCGWRQAQIVHLHNCTPGRRRLAAVAGPHATDLK